MDTFWYAIIGYVTLNPVLSPLSLLSESQKFEIIKKESDFLLIRFLESNVTLKLTKSRFLSAFNKLTENRGQWIKIGASRVNAKPETLEGRIKGDYDGKMNGLSTAPWIAAILVGAFDNIFFNGETKGQAIMMK